MLLPLEQFKNLSSHLINHSILREDTQNLTIEILCSIFSKLVCSHFTDFASPG